MIYLLGALAAAILIFAIFGTSLLFTERKSNEELAKRVPDASHIHGPDERNP